MPKEQSAVTDPSDSPSDKSGVSSSPPSKEDVITPEIAANIKAENQRKAEKILKLESALEELNLSKTELEEKVDKLENAINDNKDGLSPSELNKIMSDPKNQAILKHLREEIKKDALSVVYDQQVESANDLIDQKATELKMDVKDLIKSLFPYAAKHGDKPPLQRNAAAIKEYMEFQAKIADLDKREKELKESEEADRLYRETGSRTPRVTDAIDKMARGKTFRERAESLTDIIG